MRHKQIQYYVCQRPPKHTPDSSGEKLKELQENQTMLRARIHDTGNIFLKVMCLGVLHTHFPPLPIPLFFLTDAVK